MILVDTVRIFRHSEGRIRLLAEILIIAALILFWLEHAFQRTRGPGKHNNNKQTPRNWFKAAKTPRPLLRY